MSRSSESSSIRKLQEWRRAWIGQGEAIANECTVLARSPIGFLAATFPASSAVAARVNVSSRIRGFGSRPSSWWISSTTVADLPVPGPATHARGARAGAQGSFAARASARTPSAANDSPTASFGGCPGPMRGVTTLTLEPKRGVMHESLRTAWGDRNPWLLADLVAKVLQLRALRAARPAGAVLHRAGRRGRRS